jgi:hypothetical protein
MKPLDRSTRYQVRAADGPPRHALADPQSEAMASAYLGVRRGKPMRSGPPSLAQTVRALLPDAVRKAGPGVRELQVRWSDIVGEKLASVSEPDAIKGESLVLKVAAAAAPLLQMRANEILGLVRLAGFDRVKKLSLIRAPLIRSNLAKEASARTRAQPLDAQARRQIESELESVQDEKLKQALLNLAEATNSL